MAQPFRASFWPLAPSGRVQGRVPLDGATRLPRSIGHSFVPGASDRPTPLDIPVDADAGDALRSAEITASPGPGPAVQPVAGGQEPGPVETPPVPAEISPSGSAAAGGALGAQEPLQCECSVCYEPLFEARMAPCGHVQCRSCVDRMCKALQTMPLDRFAALGPEGPPVPRCPECRVAVHRTQYVRCYALENVARALHPGKWQAYEAARAAAGPAATGDAPAGVGDLLAWKVAQEEQAVAKTVGFVWAAVRSCLRDSTALLIKGRVEAQHREHDPDCVPGNHGGGYGGLRARRPRLVPDGHGGVDVDISELVQEDAVAEIDSVLAALWSCTAEIGRRLEAKGLTLSTFRFQGVDHALVTWPALPSSFS